MSLKLNELEKLINSELTSKIKKTTINFNELLIDTNEEELINVIIFLKSHDKLKFKQLIDIRIKVSINFEIEKKIPSITKIYPSANWMEREVFDMYGIDFTDHPDLRRILTDYNFKGHPLRKDFPLTGFNEVRYSEKEKKVIYEPVKLEQNYRDFDFESPWEGTKYIKEIKEKNIDDKKK
jgi:NADH-quinone oxidoreductase subunit C